MSTVAWDGKSIACDQQTGMSGMIELQGIPKIQRVKARFGKYAVVAAGGVGELDAINAFVDWLSSHGGEYPSQCKDRADESAFVALTACGKLLCFERRSEPVSASCVPQAYGSGAHFAMGAMLAGATAKEAVEIACRLDPHSGGKAVEYAVEDLRLHLA